MSVSISVSVSIRTLVLAAVYCRLLGKSVKSVTEASVSGIALACGGCNRSRTAKLTAADGISKDDATAATAESEGLDGFLSTLPYIRLVAIHGGLQSYLMKT